MLCSKLNCEPLDNCVHTACSQHAINTMSVWPCKMSVVPPTCSLITMPVQYLLFCFVFCLSTYGVRGWDALIVWLLKSLLNQVYLYEVGMSSVKGTLCLSGWTGICCMESWSQVDLAWCWEGVFQGRARAGQERALSTLVDTQGDITPLQSLLYPSEACFVVCNDATLHV